MEPTPNPYSSSKVVPSPGDNQSASGRRTGSKDSSSNSDSSMMLSLPKWEELVPANQPPPPPTLNGDAGTSGNIIYNYYPPNQEGAAVGAIVGGVAGGRQLLPGMPVAGGRIVSATRPPIMARPAIEPLRLIPVILTRTVVHWLRPISKHCTQEQFFRNVTETMFMEALGLFCIFYYNRPPNRASISMLHLFRMVMELGGYHAVCEKKQWANVANGFVNNQNNQQSNNQSNNNNNQQNKVSGVDLNVAQQALCSLYRINLLPFEEFHFRGTRAESLPGIDLNILRGRTEQWKTFLQQQQQLQQMPIAPQPIIAPQLQQQQQQQQQQIQVQQQPSPKNPQPPIVSANSANSVAAPSPTQSQQQAPKRLPELLRVLGEKRTSTTKLQDISGVSLAYLERCYRSGGEAQRVFVWNSLVPIIANGKLSSSDAGPLQYLAIQLEGELATFLSGEQQHDYLERITELDFANFLANVEILHEPNAKAEQLTLLLSCLVNIGNFAVFFSKRPTTVRIMETLLTRTNFLTQETWERLLEAFELVQRFCKTLSAEFTRRFTALALGDLRHSVDLMASRSVLSLQLGDVGKQEEVSAFPFNILPRHIEGTILKLLGAAYYKIQRQVSSKQQKLKREGNVNVLQQRIPTAALEDYGYVELCLMILKKISSVKTKKTHDVLLRLFSLVWDFWMSFSGVPAPAQPLPPHSEPHFSSLQKIPKLLVLLIEPNATELAQWLVQYSDLPKNSLVRQLAEPVIEALVDASRQMMIGPELVVNDWVNWMEEKARMDLILAGLKAENSDWIAFHSDLFSTNSN